MKKSLMIYVMATMSVAYAFGQAFEEVTMPKSNSDGSIWMLIAVAAAAVTAIAVAIRMKKTINWTLIAANLVVTGALFLTLYSEGLSRAGMDRSVTVLDDKGPGEIMIILAVLNILASGWLKNIPSIVLTLLTIIVAGIVINTTLEDSAYFSIFEFGAGFYMLIAGTVLLVASFPIFYLTTKKQPTALRGVEKVKN